MVPARHPASTHRADPALIGSWLDTLSKRQRALDAQIGVETARPMPDVVAIRTLRHKRLTLGDQITTLSQRARTLGQSA